MSGLSENLARNDSHRDDGLRGGADPEERPDPAEKSDSLVDERGERRALALPYRVPIVDTLKSIGLTVPAEYPAGLSVDDYRLVANPEISRLDFIGRVFAYAREPYTRILERVRFLAICAKLIDEFFEKRVNGLKKQARAGVTKRSIDRKTPQQQLGLIRLAVEKYRSEMFRLWDEELVPELKRQAGIEFRSYEDLNADQRDQADKFYRDREFLFSPQSVGRTNRFSRFQPNSLYLGVLLKEPGGKRRAGFLRIPDDIDKFVKITSATDGSLECFVTVENIVTQHLQELYKGFEVIKAWPFRIIRNLRVPIDTGAEDLIGAISEGVRGRRVSKIVRLDVDHRMPDRFRQYLQKKCRLSRSDVYKVRGPTDYSSLQEIAGSIPPRGTAQRLQYKSLTARTPVSLKPGSDLFAAIRSGDLLLHHPYIDFDSTTLALIEAAAKDPKVKVIKTTIYRTSELSPIIEALIEAASWGKHVAVAVELTASSDERLNIKSQERLHQAGIDVTMGKAGLKTHAKGTLIVREEDEEWVVYSHFSTGNYNPVTARCYVDLAMLTADPELGKDLNEFFKYLTADLPRQPEFKRLLVAPESLRAGFEKMIDREIEFARQGKEARIIAKLNGLDDHKMIQKLYEGSQAGVQIDLVVRGHCILRPGVPGYSDNIKVRSIVGRFLEHSRIFYFHNGGDPQFYIGSADWRTRNLDSRVELVVPVSDPDLKEQIKNILDYALEDDFYAWEMRPDGAYVRSAPQRFEERLVYYKRCRDLAERTLKNGPIRRIKGVNRDIDPWRGFGS
jgi:polyphosphate kinase